MHVLVLTYLIYTCGNVPLPDSNKKPQQKYDLLEIRRNVHGAMRVCKYRRKKTAKQIGSSTWVGQPTV